MPKRKKSRRPSLRGLIGNVKALGTIVKETARQELVLKPKIRQLKSTRRVAFTNQGSTAPMGREAASRLAERPSAFDAQARGKNSRRRKSGGGNSYR